MEWSNKDFSMPQHPLETATEVQTKVGVWSKVMIVLGMIVSLFIAAAILAGMLGSS